MSIAQENEQQSTAALADSRLYDYRIQRTVTLASPLFSSPITQA
jgi:hypothetical protein